MNIIKKLKPNVANRQATAIVDTDNYYQAATEWRKQIVDDQAVWLKRAFISLIALTILLALSLITNMLLLPLKQNTPYLYALNETTGELTQLGQLQPEQFNKDWLMTRFLLVRYVTNREMYDVDNLDQPYQIAWAMSDNNIAQEYANVVRTDNASSPFALYGKRKFITVHVIGIMRLNDNTAAVRFEQTLQDRDANTQQTIQKEAIVKWRYSQPETTQKMLDRDPLGFKVTYYRPSQITLDN